MHISYPGYWMPDTELEDLGASELLMLANLMERAARRTDVLRAMDILNGPSHTDTLHELEAMKRWFLFELARRVTLYDKGTGFLMHIGMKTDDYWRVKEAPA